MAPRALPGVFALAKEPSRQWHRHQLSRRVWASRATSTPIPTSPIPATASCSGQCAWPLIAGRVAQSLKKTWRDGSAQVLMQRLLVLVPRTRKHLVTCRGVLILGASMRTRVVPRDSEDFEEQDAVVGSAIDVSPRVVTGGVESGGSARGLRCCGGRLAWTRWGVWLANRSFDGVIAGCDSPSAASKAGH